MNIVDNVGVDDVVACDKYFDPTNSLRFFTDFCIDASNSSLRLYFTWNKAYDRGELKRNNPVGISEFALQRLEGASPLSEHLLLGTFS